MRTSARTRYTGYRFPAEIIGHAVWLYVRLPLGLRMAEKLLAARAHRRQPQTARQPNPAAGPCLPRRGADRAMTA